MLDLFFHFLLAMMTDVLHLRKKATADFIAHIEKIQVHQQALKKADVENDPHAEVMALIQLGNEHAAFEETQTSITMYQRARATAHKMGDHALEMTALVNMASLYANLQDFQRSYEYYKQALEIARKVGKKDFEETILQQIDKLYYAIKADELSKPSRKEM